MPLTENQLYPRFNDSSVPDSAHTLKWVFNQRASTPGSDARLRRQSRPYIWTEISNLLLNVEQRDYLMWLNWWTQGNVKLILMRVSIFCEIGTQIGTNKLGYPIIEPAFLGNGDGTEKTYQIVKTLSGEGYNDHDLFYEVTKPHLDYPVLKNLSGNPWTPATGMRDVEVFTNPSPGVYTSQPRNLWACNRKTGKITTSLPGNLFVAGGFYIAMLMPPGIPILSAGKDHPGLFKVGENVRLEEPPGLV